MLRTESSASVGKRALFWAKPFSWYVSPPFETVW
jgi:hypothetical protein